MYAIAPGAPNERRKFCRPIAVRYITSMSGLGNGGGDGVSYPGRLRRDRLNPDAMARAALFIIMILLCAATWRKWGNLVIDCGREWYVPAAIVQGKRLYADIWYIYGPLIPYWHALLFRLFGVHLWILEAIGIGIIAAIVWLLYSLSRRFLPPALSFTAAFAFLLQAFRLGSFDPEFNYVLPYAYPAAYGVLMFVLLTWLIVRDASEPKRWTWLAAGVIAGLESITKAEFGVFAWLLVAAAILLKSRLYGSLRFFVSAAAASAPGLALAAGVYGWYVHWLGMHAMFADNISILPNSYFETVMGKIWAYRTGSAAPWSTIPAYVLSGAGGVLLTAGAIRLAAVPGLISAVVLAAAFLLPGFYVATLYANSATILSVPPWILDTRLFLYFNPGMLFASALLAIWILAGWLRRKPKPEDVPTVLLLAAAVLLGSRTMFKLQPGGYSIFYNALEFIGCLVAVRKLALLLRAPDRPRLWWGTAAALCCGLLAIIAGSYREVRARSFAVDSGRGGVYTTAAVGQPFRDVLAFLEAVHARHETFAVWPEEAALYYFTGATAPSRWWDLMPGVLPTGDETRRFLEELDAQQVKYIVLSNRSTSEYGLPKFGIDYNQQPYRWLESRYQVIRTFGEYRRANPGSWAVQVWERAPEQERVRRVAWAAGDQGGGNSH